MKRFYKDVSVARADGGFAVLLDGRPVKTPARNTLLLPTPKLAQAIAAEWAGQGDTIIATSMPLLRLSNTVIDGVNPNRDEVVNAILRFGENDLLCYRAHQPPELVKRQAEGWDPMLDWARRRLSAHMRVVDGINHVDQSADAVEALREAMHGYDAFTLGGLHVAASITGSLVLGLALVEGQINPAQAFQLSRIDEVYQAEKWGEDAEAVKRATNLAHELDKAFELISSIR